MGAFKLGKMTFGSLFKKPETVLYPIEVKPQPTGLKGHIVIDVDRCIVCGMCDRNCSTDCIAVDRKARTWSINPFACVQCGYCVTVCPKDCLFMDPSYFPVAAEKTSQTFSIPEQAKAEKEAVATRKEQRVEQPAKAEAPEPETLSESAHDQDEQLQGLLALMDADKAARVQAALSR